MKDTWGIPLCSPGFCCATPMNVQKDRIRQLEEKIAELRARLPRHSIPPSMLMELEELEDELSLLLAQEESMES